MLSAVVFILSVQLLCVSQYSDDKLSEDSSLAGCNGIGTSSRQVKKSLLDPDDEVSVP